MLSIGEFSNICQVSTKTLRYYAEIGLILPTEVTPENGYRYYSIEQLETMLFINRLKAYHFSLDEIKMILESDELLDETLFQSLIRKKEEINRQVLELTKISGQLDQDLKNLKEGKSIMSYLNDIDVKLTEAPLMYLLSIRKRVHKYEIAEEYKICFGQLFQKIEAGSLTPSGPPMVLFHNDEFSPSGLDIEFAVPIKEYATGTRTFSPGLCLRTVLHGSYTALSSIYARQRKWAEDEGYEGCSALFEVYVKGGINTSDEREYITEIYFPVRKKR